MSTDKTASNQTPTEAKPEISESAREAAAEMASAYEDRPTAVLPGSHNTVTGTAVNDWLDDDGNPKYGKAESDRE
ncbi:hypothetical protein [Mycolicibacterium tokaiense]|uniref:Uncharacterized protein n=1 Tax=Mycolicibacterium tokaiense TaxID=39695 RepID=A0A378TMS8_9MYCO|nr:hypothetical protein [Mycolicibacterium tokaiense]BBY84407.1 hypothetical protein MTOK_01890 [Mycolicibacterium tokaiense]STZ61085.1 Uncharacterised protein [Mycolicibacterium tokaiense]